MTDFFFPDNKCGIGEQVEKPQFKFVADCFIEPTPKPIFDCPLPVIAREPEIPCPEFNVKSKLDVGFSSSDPESNRCELGSSIKFDIKKKPNDTCPADANNCEFDVELEVVVAVPPTPCPVIKVNTFSVKSGFSDQPCVEDDSTFKITTRKTPGDCDNPGSCEFDVDLEIVVPIPRPPCPEINVRTFDVRSGYTDSCGRGTNRFEITTRHRPPTSCDDTGDCKFDVDLEIFVPLPRPPCPEIKITTFKVKAGFEKENCPLGENKFEIRRIYEQTPCDDPTRPPKCEFEIDLEIYIPIPQTPCPEIRVTKFEVKSGYANSECANGVNRFRITKREVPGNCETPPQCQFDVELEINIPIPQPPCPKINIKKFEVKSGYSDCVQGNNRFVIVTQHTPPENCKDDAGECEFNIELEIFVPIPRPPCPKIEVTKFNVVIGYPFQVCDPTPDGQCSGPNRFVIKRREQQQPCDKPNEQNICEFDIELEIFIPSPKIPCPTLRIKKFEVKTGYEDSECVVDKQNRFEITQRIIPCTCDEPERCEFDIELEIVVPIPKPPCPVFNVNVFKVKTKYPNQQCPDSKFVIKKKDKPWRPEECTLPEDETKCEFDIELEIVVPLPEPPCPDINVKTFKVKSGYSRCTTGSNVFRVTKKITPPTSENCDEEGEPAKCEFDIELEIFVPIPEPPCPDINIKNFNVNYIVTNTPPVINQACNRFTVTKRKIPTPCEDDSGQTPACEFDLDLQICIPVFVPPCPVINVRSFVVTSQYQDCPQGPNVFRVTSTNNGGVCQFDIDLAISIPIPRPPCPLFGTNIFVRTGLTGCVVPFARFVATPFIFPGNCNTPEQCAFIFDLNLQIPLPRFVSDVFLTPLPGQVKIAWCPIGANPVGSTASLLIQRQANFWAGACDRGDAVWYTMQLDIDLVIARFPCEYIDLKTKREQIPVRRICNLAAEEYLKVFIRRGLGGGAGCAPCEFEFDFDLQLRRPCRTLIYGNTGQVITNGCYDTTVANQNQPPSDPNDPFAGNPAPTTGGAIWLEVTRVQTCGDGSAECVDSFALTPYIELPPPKIPCPQFYAANRVKIEFYDNYVQLPYGDLRFEEVPKIDPCDPCVFDVYLDLNLPKPCVPTFTFNGSKSTVNRCIYTSRRDWEQGVCGADYIEVYIEQIEPCKYEVYTYSKPAVFVPALVCDEFVPVTKVDYLSNPNDPPRADLQIKARPPGVEDEYCTYDVTLDLYVPRGCVPTFTYSSGESVVNPCFYSEPDICVGNDPVEVYIESAGDPADLCKYKVRTYYKPHIYRPTCPYIHGSLTVTQVEEWSEQNSEAEITFTSNGYTADSRCDIEMSGTIYVPKSNNKCPEIWFSPGGFRVIPVDDWLPAYEAPDIEFRDNGITPDGRCSIELFGDLLVPSGKRKECDEFTGVVTASWAAAGSNPSGTLEIYPNSGPDDRTGKCTYAVTLDLSIPRCEPTFSRGAQYVNIYTTTGNSSGSLNVNINKSSGCNYNVNADLTLYLPQSKSTYVAVRNYSASWTACGGDPTLNVSITPPNQNGVQYLDISIGIPSPPSYIGETWQVTDSNGSQIGYATSMVDSTGCSRKVGGSIQLNTTTCPTYSNFTAMPMTEGPGEETGNADGVSPENSIMSPWDVPSFVDGFIDALQTNDRLRAAVKTLLQE